jgi:hypothetical protein
VGFALGLVRENTYASLCHYPKTTVNCPMPLKPLKRAILRVFCFLATLLLVRGRSSIPHDVKFHYPQGYTALIHRVMHNPQNMHRVKRGRMA